jgi:hypothetical protein
MSEVEPLERQVEENAEAGRLDGLADGMLRERSAGTRRVFDAER